MHRASSIQRSAEGTAGVTGYARERRRVAVELVAICAVERAGVARQVQGAATAAKRIRSVEGNSAALGRCNREGE